jgi:non-homologous end joining protein Ku
MALTGGRRMKFIDKLKEWWNEPSWEDEFNEALVDYVRDVKDKKNAREEKLKSYESMSERQLLIEIAKNTLMEIEE